MKRWNLHIAALVCRRHGVLLACGQAADPGSDPGIGRHQSKR